MTERPIHLLLVEDEAGFAYLLRAVLTNLPASRFETDHARTLAEAVALLGTKRFDVVLLDLSLPDRSGLDTYLDLQKAAPTLPIIVLTGTTDESMALHAVREGAQDYLVKGQADGKMLSRVIRYAIERKHAEEAVRRSEEFFRLISENVSDLIAVIDEDGRRLYNSPSYRRLLGEPQDLRGTDSFEELHVDDRERVRELFRQTLATGVGQRAEYRLVTRAGEIRHIESQGNAICDDKGRPCKVVVVARDITDRKESLEVLRHALSDVKRSHDDLKAAQQQLIRAERLEAISTFAAGVAHEVRNPLQTLTLGLDYLSGQNGDNSQALAVVRDMDEAVQRADGIIQGLVEFSTLSQRSPGDENLNDIIVSALRAVESELANYPVVVERQLAAQLPLVRLDRRSMKHVFINLLMTAINAMTGGGTLSLRTSQILFDPKADLPAPAAKPGEPLVVVEIADTGASVLEQTKIGSGPRETTRPIRPGSGLALVVVKKIVALYGGVVDVRATDPVGVRVRLVFKISPPTV